jgi:hypothetical protein
VNAAAPCPAVAPAPDDDAACRQAAKQLRSQYPQWLVIWVARTRLYHAIRLSASWHATGLTDPQPAGLAAQIEQAERAAASRRPRQRRSTGT